MSHWIRLCAKVEQAEKHLKNLRAEWEKYRAQAFLVQSKDDAQTGERVWYLAHAYAIPADMPTFLEMQFIV
jgi:hypothetical protein